VLSYLDAEGKPRYFVLYVFLYVYIGHSFLSGQPRARGGVST